jgi:hypothetical protein
MVVCNGIKKNKVYNETKFLHYSIIVEELAKLQGNFSFSREESIGIEVCEEDIEGIISKKLTCLIGKLIVEWVAGRKPSTQP